MVTMTADVELENVAKKIASIARDPSKPLDEYCFVAQVDDLLQDTIGEYYSDMSQLENELENTNQELRLTRDRLQDARDKLKLVLSEKIEQEER